MGVLWPFLSRKCGCSLPLFETSLLYRRGCNERVSVLFYVVGDFRFEIWDCLWCGVRGAGCGVRGIPTFLLTAFGSSLSAGLETCTTRNAGWKPAPQWWGVRRRGSRVEGATGCLAARATAVDCGLRVRAPLFEPFVLLITLIMTLFFRNLSCSAVRHPYTGLQYGLETKRLSQCANIG